MSWTESDLALLQLTSDQSAQPILTKPLSPRGNIHTHKGNISHADIIGKHGRDIVQTSSGARYRIQQVSLGDYARLTKRLVTPVCPFDTSMLISG